MVPTQDIAQLVTSRVAGLPLDMLPAGVVAVVILAFAIALVTVSVRRRDAD